MKPVVDPDHVYPFDQAKEAYEACQAQKVVGKCVIRVG